MSDDTNAGEASPQDTGGQPDPGNQGAPPPPPASAAPPPAAAATPPPQYHAPGPDATGQHQQPQAPDATGQVQYVVQRTGPNLTVTPNLVFALVAIAAIALAVFIPEAGVADSPEGDKGNLWDRVGGLWSIVAIVAAVATLLPALRTVVNLDEKRAWTIAGGAAGFLTFWWVVFILPGLNFNVAFLATIGIIAAGLAAWTSPGNPYKRTTDVAPPL